MNAGQYGQVLCARIDGIAKVTIDRPQKLNAFTHAMYRGFREILDTISADTSIRCVMLMGAGNRAFCVGSGIGEFETALGDPDRQIAEARVGRAAVDALLACPHPVVASINGACLGGGLELAAACDLRIAGATSWFGLPLLACPHPVVASINGACLGGGLELAAACDLRIAGATSWFGLPVKSLGMFAELEDLQALVVTVGRNLTADLLLTGRRLEAREARERGFLSRLVGDRDVERAAVALAQEIAVGAPLAARWHKRALRLISAAGAIEAEVFREAHACYATADFAEGARAFLEKRAPRFSEA